MVQESDQHPRNLDRSELIDLFKHWDTRVSHQELLFVPLAAAALPAVAATWDKISAPVIALVAGASLGVYLYHLFSIRRIAVFQEVIFEKLEDKFSDFADIIHSRGRFGVQRLRLIGLPVLGCLWAALLLSKLDPALKDLPYKWWLVVVCILSLSGGFFAFLWVDTTRET